MPPKKVAGRPQTLCVGRGQPVRAGLACCWRSLVTRGCDVLLLPSRGGPGLIGLSWLPDFLGAVMAVQSNLAARLGGWSARHRVTAITGWVVLVLVGMLIGHAVGQMTMKQSE